MNDLIEIKTKILKATDLLAKMRVEIKARAERKAKAISNYDKALAVTIIGLKNGKKMILDGEEIEKPPTTILEKIAKGICYKEKLELEEAEALYKSLISNIDSLKAELNGYQSINRHLD